MSQAATAWPLAALALVTAAFAWGQLPAPQNPDWRRLGLPSIDSHLAGAATGPIANVWDSADGGTLFARTSAGLTYQTADYENWTPAPNAVPEENSTAATERSPEPQARVATASGDSRRIWSLGHNLSVS